MQYVKYAGKSLSLLIGLGMFAVLSNDVRSQGIEFASSPNPVGSGARALGMGGAFIAVADDATAASWNPAGLIQLEAPEVSIVGAGYHRSEDNTFSGHPEADGDQSLSEADLNYLSGAYPFSLVGKNMIVALAYQHLYDFNRSWQFPYYYQEDQSVSFDMEVDYEQEGGLSAFGLSYAVQILDVLSTGLTVNIWDDALGYNNWQQLTSFSATGELAGIPLQETYRKLDDYELQGINANIGFLWHITGSLTLGGVYKTPFTADLRHHETLYQTITSSDSVLWEIEYDEWYDEELDMPASYGFGLAYRFSDKLTMAMDLYRTEWDDMILTDHEGEKTSAVSGLSESESNIDPTIQVRTGLEYLHIQPKYVVPLRAGLFYDPAPSEDGQDDFYGITLGTGYGRGRFVFDAGYQFRFGSDVGSAIYKSGELGQDVQEHTFYSSLIVHF